MIENVGIISDKDGGGLRKMVSKIVFPHEIENKQKKAEFISKYFNEMWVVKYLGSGRLPIRGIPTQMDLFRFYEHGKQPKEKKGGRKR